MTDRPASLDTPHCLVLTVDLDSQVDVKSTLDHAEFVATLRLIADRFEALHPDAVAAEAQGPAVGDRYVSRHVSRTVTVTRVWTAEDGHTAVAYEWRDDRPGLCESACPVDVFHRAYRAEAQPTPPVTACAHGYILMQDSCPGCDAEQETPHTADPVAVLPRWAPRGMIRCRRCSLAPSHRIHRAEAQQPAAAGPDQQGAAMPERYPSMGDATAAAMARNARTAARRATEAQQ